MLTFLRNSNIITFADIESNRSVAQFGRALRSGRRGRGFESRRFDCIEESLKTLCVQAFFALEIIDKTGVSR